ncbi:MAG: IS200/IS605-like element ISEfa4 family transposase [Rectinema sp.]
MSEYNHKNHNVSVLLYHIVCPAKYRKVVFSEEVDKTLRDICIEIENRYEIKFIEIGTEKDHVHFLVQSVPTYSPSKIVQIIKSITAKKIFERCPEVKKALWGGEFWTKGYYIGSTGKHGDEELIGNYVKSQGRNPEEYKRLYVDNQLKLFE